MITIPPKIVMPSALTVVIPSALNVVIPSALNVVIPSALNVVIPSAARNLQFCIDGDPSLRSG